MLQREFYSRTGIQPTADEWAKIEAAYMACEADKDIFCRLWCKANATRVQRAKEAKKEAERREEYTEKITGRVLRYVYAKADAPERALTWQERLENMAEELRKALRGEWESKEARDVVRQVQNWHGVTSNWGCHEWAKYNFLFDAVAYGVH